MATIVVGIGVSKDKLDIAVRPGGDLFATSRDAQGLDAVIGRLAPLSPVAVAVEATGGFETGVAASLAAAGLPVVVVNPAQVRAFAQALGKRAKTDPIDACVIAHFAAAAKPEIRPLPDEAARLSLRSHSKAPPDHRDDRRRAAAPTAARGEAYAKEHRASPQGTRKRTLRAR